MKILIACEESQTVCKSMRELGHEAYSCDILPCSGGHPEWHIQCDIMEVLGEQIRIVTQDGVEHWIDKWDLMIAHPPCTYLSKAGTRWLYPQRKLNQERYKKGIEGKDFFMKLFNANIPMIAVENPVPHRVFDMPKETQRIQPYDFGHPIKKTTLLWLKGLPNLQSTNVTTERINYFDKKGIKHTGLNGWSAKRKSKTFSGIAQAMANQWTTMEVKSGCDANDDGIPPNNKLLGILPNEL